jgi:hypothetical protein
LDANIYRIYAAFPVKRAFLVAVEQPFVSIADNAQLESGVGDLMVRMRARLWGARRVLWALGSLAVGTGEARFFPYSSESVDLNLALAATDSVGIVDLFASAGIVWAQRVPDQLVTQHSDHTRFTLGAGMRMGDRGGIRAGFITLNYSDLDARRDLVFAGAGYAWTESMRFFLEGQVETGPVAERASDWGATAGIAIRF